MNRSPYQPAARSVRTAMQTTKGAADFLRAHDKMASLLPTVTRMAALQQDCAALLPAIFGAIAIVQFQSGQLALSIPNAALAAKLKQQLPKIQDGLLKRGWQVSSIRLKLQPRNIAENTSHSKELILPKQAISALAALNATLENSPRNDALKAAIAAMVDRHRTAR